MAQAKVFDPSRAADYQAYVDRNRAEAPNDLVGTRFFWRSDYLVHRRPTFMASLKLSSNRVIGAELVNSENLSGYHIADGATYFYRRGDEYADVFPVWDWRRLPGVTCLQSPVPPFKTSQVARDFIGGLSDGSVAVAVMDYERDGVKAHKAWFFAGDSVLCLGSGISSKVSGPVATSINQCLLRGEVSTLSPQGVRSPLPKGARELSGVHALEHDGWTYTVFDGGVLRLESGPVTGNWHRVFNNPDSPAKDLTKELFTLWFDHGKTPKEAVYAYLVGPTGSPCAFGAWHNEPALQSATLVGGSFAVVFWGAGETRLPDGRTLSVNQPCLVLVTKEGIRVCDPTQKLRIVGVSVEGAKSDIVLPVGALAGTAAMVGVGPR
jgi:chondroitin AC lyase